MEYSDRRLSDVIDYVSKLLVDVDILEENAKDDQNTINYLVDCLN